MAVVDSAEAVIRRSCDEVAACVANPGEAPESHVNAAPVRWLSEPRVRGGSQIAFVAQFLGARLACICEVVEVASGERPVMRTAQGPFPLERIHVWGSTPEGGIRVTLHDRVTPAGFSTPAAPLTAAPLRRADKKDPGRLKALLEARRSASKSE